MSETKALSPVEYLVLVALGRGADHGYAIMSTIEESNVGQTVGPGALYGALKRLRARELVREIGDESRRRTYELTPAGRRAAAAEAAHLEALARFAVDQDLSRA